MARRWVISAVVGIVLVVAAVLVARAIRDDDHSDDASRRTTTTSVTTTTGAPSTTAATTPTPASAPSTTATTSPSTPPGPCGTQLGPIKTAVGTGVPNATANLVGSCRLAASDPTWASVELTNGPGGALNGRFVVLHGDGGAWAVVASGGTEAGCGQAPQQVIADLGQFCAGTGGSAQ
jgi:hypothetical protein